MVRRHETIPVSISTFRILAAASRYIMGQVGLARVHEFFSPFIAVLAIFPLKSRLFGAICELLYIISRNRWFTNESLLCSQIGVLNCD